MRVEKAWGACQFNLILWPDEISLILILPVT